MRAPKFLVKIGHFFKKHGPVMLSAVSVAGVVGTFALTIAKNEEAHERKEKAEKEKGSELTKFETFKAEAPAYILPAVTCLATSGTIVANAIVNKKIQAGLVAAAAMSARAYASLTEEERKEIAMRHAEDDHGKLADEPIAGTPGEGKVLWYEDYTGQYFYQTEAQVRCAELNVANSLLYYGAVCFDDYLYWLGADRVPGSDKVGWGTWVGEAMYGYLYVQFEHTECTLSDGTKCIAITYQNAPHADYLEDI